MEANQERIVYWISKGAKPSATVASLLKSLGMKDMDKYMTQPNRKAKKKKASDEPEVQAAPAEEATA